MSYEIDGVRLVDDVGNVYDIEEWLHGYVELPRDANNITQELREWWVRKFPVMDKELHRDFIAIADRIDAKYEDAVRKKAARMLTKTSEYMNDDDLAEIGLVRLPVDADGVPIRVGDDVEEVDCDSRGKVYGLQLYENEWWVIVEGVCRRPHRYRHYKPPIVEDVLSDFARLYDDIGGRENEAELWETLLAEYAAKLQLRSEDA